MHNLSKSTKSKLLIPIMYLILACTYFVYSAVYEPITFHHIIGATITISAFLLWITSRIQLGNSFSLAPKATHLVKSGIYSKLRHPIYYFSILAVLGLVVFSWSIYLLFALSLLLVVEVFRIKQEEIILEQKFGSDYIDYKKSTWF